MLTAPFFTKAKRWKQPKWKVRVITLRFTPGCRTQDMGKSAGEAALQLKIQKDEL